MMQATSRIAPLDPASADPATAALFDTLRAKFGRVPNVTGVLAHAPAALSVYLGARQAIAQGALTNAQQEIVALAVGQSNACGYCLSAHTQIGKAAGLSPEAMLDARRGSGATAADAALSIFAKRLTERRGIVSDAEYAEFLDAGFDHGAAMEVVASVAINTLTNYANHLAQTEVDFPVVSIDLGV